MPHGVRLHVQPVSRTAFAALPALLGTTPTTILKHVTCAELVLAQTLATGIQLLELCALVRRALPAQVRIPVNARHAVSAM